METPEIDHGPEANKIPADADESLVPDADQFDPDEAGPDPDFGETDDESVLDAEADEPE